LGAEGACHPVLRAPTATLDQARRDHAEMLKVLRQSRREALISLTRRHLKPAPEAYIRGYKLRFAEDA
jgi:hypothetical protein